MAWTDIPYRSAGEFITETMFNELVDNDIYLQAALSAVENYYDSSSVPRKAICLWYGNISVDGLPEDWQVCDGTNGLPDLRGLFVMGAANDSEIGDSDNSTQHLHAHSTGQTGGIGSHSHTVAMHYTAQPNSNRSVGGVGVGFTSTTHYHTITPTLSDSGTHNHYVGNTGATESKPPYKKLHWIGRI